MQHLGNLLPLAGEKSPELVGDLLDRLEKAGVPYVIEAGTALDMLGNEVALDKPDPWQARIWIAAGFADLALPILAEVDMQFGRRRVPMTFEPRGRGPGWNV